MSLFKKNKTDLEKDKFKVDFIGIGAPRCATTWIAACLDEHPQICISRPKETNYFLQHYKKGLKYYRSCFNHCEPGQIKGEYSQYQSRPEAIERIKKHNANVKLITCLRNPVERAYSHYLYYRSQERSLFPFLEALEKNKVFIDNSLYFTYLKEFFKNFPKENILVLIYEDIQKNPLKFIQNIYKFLGVDLNFIPQSLDKKINITSCKKRVKIPYLNLMINLSEYYLEEHRSKFLIKPLYEFLRLTHASRFSSLIIRWNTTKRMENGEIDKPVIDLEIRRRSRSIFKEEVKNLEKLIDRDLSFWK
jgi:hypothetical protein